MQPSPDCHVIHHAFIFAGTIDELGTTSECGRARSIAARPLAGLCQRAAERAHRHVARAGDRASGDPRRDRPRPEAQCSVPQKSQGHRPHAAARRRHRGRDRGRGRPHPDGALSEVRSTTSGFPRPRDRGVVRLRRVESARGSSWSGRWTARRSCRRRPRRTRRVARIRSIPTARARPARRELGQRRPFRRPARRAGRLSRDAGSRATSMTRTTVMTSGGARARCRRAPEPDGRADRDRRLLGV